jgi:hypothetical protein
MQTGPDLARNFGGFLQLVKGPGARNWFASTNSSQASSRFTHRIASVAIHQQSGDANISIAF